MTNFSLFPVVKVDEVIAVVISLEQAVRHWSSANAPAPDNVDALVPFITEYRTRQQSTVMTCVECTLNRTQSLTH